MEKGLIGITTDIAWEAIGQELCPNNNGTCGSHHFGNAVLHFFNNMPPRMQPFVKILREDIEQFDKHLPTTNVHHYRCRNDFLKRNQMSTDEKTQFEIWNAMWDNTEKSEEQKTAQIEKKVRAEKTFPPVHRCEGRTRFRRFINATQVKLAKNFIIKI